LEENYNLAKTTFNGITIKEIRYKYNYETLNKPTRWIKIILHHTGKNKNIKDIIDQHIKKNLWSSIGYHFIITKRGAIIYSRKLDTAGVILFLSTLWVYLVFHNYICIESLL
jgi:hypothetical protein